VSEVSTLAEATMLPTDGRFPEHAERDERWCALCDEGGVSRTSGDCYGYPLLATGRAAVRVDDIVNPWHAAAIMLIIEEAGGVFTDWTGRRTAFGSDLIATNAALSDVVRSRLVHGGAA
jgi:histidinol-phosphatase